MVYKFNGYQLVRIWDLFIFYLIFLRYKCFDRWNSKYIFCDIICFAIVCVFTVLIVLLVSSTRPTVFSRGRFLAVIIVLPVILVGLFLVTVTFRMLFFLSIRTIFIIIFDCFYSQCHNQFLLVISTYIFFRKYDFEEQTRHV